jgi:peptidoglycan L-alanyl-D-glutamate endopeptidase CwlK
MSKSDEQWLFLQDVAKLVLFAHAHGYKLTGGELYRTQEQQDIYFAEGKSQVKRSNHQDRLAIDLNLFVDGDIQWSKNEHWEKLGEYWKQISPENKWGGDYKSFSDPYHFQRDI